MSSPLCISAHLQRSVCDHLNHCVRGVSALSRRGAMDQGGVSFRIQLASRAGGSRETSRQTIHRDTRSTTPKRQMDNIMYLYEQPGPPDDAPKATAAAEDGGLGGLNWVAWRVRRGGRRPLHLEGEEGVLAVERRDVERHASGRGTAAAAPRGVAPRR